MRLTSDEAVTVILLAVLACCITAERRRHRREQAAQHQQFLRDYQAGLDGGARNTLGALIDATREDTPLNLAWGPPRQRLHVWFLRCGCTVVEDATGTQTFPCAACEAIAEVENRTEQT